VELKSTAIIIEDVVCDSKVPLVPELLDKPFNKVLIIRHIAARRMNNSDFYFFIFIMLNYGQIDHL